MTGIRPYGLKQKAMTDDELVSMQSGARIKGLLPEVRDTIEGQLRRVTTQAVTAIAKGELTPERAQSLWFEYSALTNVLRGMENRARLGDAAGQKLAAMINNDD